MKRQSHVMLAVLAILFLLVTVPAHAQSNSLTLDSVAGVAPTGYNVYPETDITFYLRFTVAGSPSDMNITGALNGFRIYSPDGATWRPITSIPYFDFGCFCYVVLYPGWDEPPYFNDNIFVNPFGVTGEGADTIGFGGNCKAPSEGVPAGFSGVVYSITTSVDSTEIGKHICIDTSWYPPSGRWIWFSDTGLLGDIYPSWDGPHCFTIGDGDSDGDEIADYIDNCPETANNPQIDSDSDGIGDECDLCPGFDDSDDIDYDNIPDACDNCPESFNNPQTDSDSDGFGDVCDICPGYDDNEDTDLDNVPDGCDNCPEVPNPQQEDTDDQPPGDACCCLGMRGNTNGDPDDNVNIADVTYVVNYLFGIPSGPRPPCPAEGNANGDPEETVNISDVTYLTTYLFGIPPGPEPPACP